MNSFADPNPQDLERVKKLTQTLRQTLKTEKKVEQQNLVEQLELNIIIIISSMGGEAQVIKDKTVNPIILNARQYLYLYYQQIKPINQERVDILRSLIFDYTLGLNPQELGGGGGGAAADPAPAGGGGGAAAADPDPAGGGAAVAVDEGVLLRRREAAENLYVFTLVGADLSPYPRAVSPNFHYFVSPKNIKVIEEITSFGVGSVHIKDSGKKVFEKMAQIFTTNPKKRITLNFYTHGREVPSGFLHYNGIKRHGISPEPVMNFLDAMENFNQSKPKESRLEQIFINPVQCYHKPFMDRIEHHVEQRKYSFNIAYFKATQNKKACDRSLPMSLSSYFQSTSSRVFWGAISDSLITSFVSSFHYLKLFNLQARPKAEYLTDLYKILQSNFSKPAQERNLEEFMSLTYNLVKIPADRRFFLTNFLVPKYVSFPIFLGIYKHRADNAQAYASILDSQKNQSFTESNNKITSVNLKEIFRAYLPPEYWARLINVEVYVTREGRDMFGAKKKLVVPKEQWALPYQIKPNEESLVLTFELY